jgi:hypothetical protein
MTILVKTVTMKYLMTLPYLFTFGLVTLPSIQGVTQNLINNPSFESGTIPTTADQVPYATGWDRGCGTWRTSGGSVIQGSPDLFDSRSVDCKHDAPSNKWAISLSPHNGGYRYVGLSGGYEYMFGVYGPWYGETVRGTLSEALTSSSCTYKVTFRAAAERDYQYPLNQCVTYLPVAASTHNKIQVVLRKDNICTSEVWVYTTPQITSSSWTEYTGWFTLTSQQAAVGYNKIEFRLMPEPNNDSNNGTVHVVFLDNVSLEKEMNSTGHSSDFTLIGTAIAGNNVNYKVTASVASIPADAGFYWEVSEIHPTTGVVISGTTMTNPTNWWHSSLWYTNTFPGYCCNSSPITGDGTFLLGHKYRVTRGVWGPCHPWTQTVKTVYMSTSGMVVEDESSYLSVKALEDEIEESGVWKGLKIYPNPAADKLTVELPYKGPYRLRIISATGAILNESNQWNFSTSINITGLPNGLYIAEVSNPSGESERRTFVVQH